MLINEIVPLKQKVEGCKFGIEIEMEGKNLPTSVVGMQIKKDGSLRGVSAEYVFSRPYDMNESLNVLERFSESLVAYKTIPNYSFRTSTHTHVNVSDMDHIHVLNMIYLYLLVEDAFVNYAGKDRVGNRFCLRMRDAEGILGHIHECFGKDFAEQLNYLAMEKLKYGSINIAAIRVYGSLEFRSLSGTHEIKRIKPWLESLANLRSLAVQYENPFDIYKKFIMEGKELELFDLIFGDNKELFAYENMRQDIAFNASLSISIPFELTAKIEDVVVKKVRSKKVEVNPLDPNFQQAVEILWDNAQVDMPNLNADGGRIRMAAPPRINPVGIDFGAFIADIEVGNGGV